MLYNIALMYLLRGQNRCALRNSKIRAPHIFTLSENPVFSNSVKGDRTRHLRHFRLVTNTAEWKIQPQETTFLELDFLVLVYGTVILPYTLHTFFTFLKATRGPDIKNVGLRSVMVSFTLCSKKNISCFFF